MGKKYCLDTNVLIQAWQKYYSPTICPSYWDMLNQLGIDDVIFLPEMVYNEIARTDDELSRWLKTSHIPIRPVDEQVASCLKDIFSADPNHKHLVDNIKARSLADPWVIAHALKEHATVVTKEEKVTALNTTRIKIPNVCEKMNVTWINDFQLIVELGIRFSCEMKSTFCELREESNLVKEESMRVLNEFESVDLGDKMKQTQLWNTEI